MANIPDPPVPSVPPAASAAPAIPAAGSARAGEMHVTYGGFEPETFRVKAGTDVAWTIRGDQVTGCTNRIVIHDPGIQFRGRILVECPMHGMPTPQKSPPCSNLRQGGLFVMPGAGP